MKPATVTMQNIKPKTCWLCNLNIADSSEHKFKSGTHKKGGFWIFKDGFEPKYIQGKNSKHNKYNYIICHQCNTARSQPWDKAYDKLFIWMKNNQSNYTIQSIDFKEIYGTEWKKEINNLLNYFTKSLGCRILAENNNVALPDNFPNPLQKNNSSLKISICRRKEFPLWKFKSNEFATYRKHNLSLNNNVMSKGDIIINMSAKQLINKGIRKIVDCITWEQIGTFQITYWLNIETNIVYGRCINMRSRTYILNYLNNLVSGDVLNSLKSWLYKEN